MKLNRGIENDSRGVYWQAPEAASHLDRNGYRCLGLREFLRTWRTGLRKPSRTQPQPEWGCGISALTRGSPWPYWCLRPRKPEVSAATPLRMCFPLSRELLDQLIQREWIQLAKIKSMQPAENWKEISWVLLYLEAGFPGGSGEKKLHANAGDTG